MRYFHRKGNLSFCPSINLDKVWTLVGEDVRKEHASKTDVAPVIDVTKFVRGPPPLSMPPVASLSFVCATCSGVGEVRSG